MVNGDMQIVKYKAEDIISAEYNPRQLSKNQYKDLKDSMTRFGIVDPLIININKDRKNILVGGHQRLKVAADMEIKEIPCVEVDLSLDQEKELNIRLNKNSGEWDWNLLANNFDNKDLISWGFTEDEMSFFEEEPTEGLTDDDEVPEVEESITNTGDIWILGEHRVLCGDATKKEDVELLMDGEKVDMVFTDPPYGINYRSNKRKEKFDYIKNDDVIDGKFLEYIKLNSNSSLYVFTRWDVYSDWELIVSDKYKVENCLVWSKVAGGLGNLKSYWNQHEFIIYATNGDVSLRGKRQGNLWETSYHRSKDYLHPTQKPVELCVRGIKATSDNGHNIIDPFLGSGSTLIACEKTGRKCYGMEIDAHYCDVIVKRWEDYTGKKAERIEVASA